MEAVALDLAPLALWSFSRPGTIIRCVLSSCSFGVCIVYRVSCIVVRCLYVVFESVLVSVYRRPSTMHRITQRIEGGDGEEHKESNQITDRQSLFYGTTLKLCTHLYSSTPAAAASSSAGPSRPG